METEPAPHGGPSRLAPGSAGAGAAMSYLPSGCWRSGFGIRHFWGFISATERQILAPRAQLSEQDTLGPESRLVEALNVSSLEGDIVWRRVGGGVARVCVCVCCGGASLCSLGDRVCLLKSSHLSSCPSSCLPVRLLSVFHSSPKQLTPPAFTPEVPRADRTFLGSLGGC